MPRSQTLLSVSLVAYDSQGNRVDFPSLFLVDESSSPLPYREAVALQPGGSYTFFDGTRTTGADGTTVFTLALSPLVLDPVYRFTWTGGTSPALRTPRAVSLAAVATTVTVNANETATFAAPAATFAAAQVGDSVFVPGVVTGDSASPFNEANAGFWTVLAKNGAASQLQLARRVGESFSAFGETVIPVSASDFVVFGPGPVQVADYVRVVGFSAAVNRTWRVREVVPTWFEVVASDPLPSAEVGAAGTPPTFYSQAKRLLGVTTDQQVDPTVNGVALPRLVPVSPGSVPGVLLETGPVFSLAVTNASANVANVSAWGVA